MASKTAADLVQQISAASTVLAGLRSLDATTQRAVASAQKHRIEAAIRGVRGFDLSDIAALTSALSASAFADADKESLLRAVVQSDTLSASPNGSKFQNWESLPSFCPHHSSFVWALRSLAVPYCIGHFAWVSEVPASPPSGSLLSFRSWAQRVLRRH